MATLRFAKLHGTANDFIYVDARAGFPATPRRSRPGSATAAAASAPTASFSC